MDVYQRSLKMHEENQGKVYIESKVNVATKEDLSLAYTPGVAQPCKEIEKDNNLAYKYTNKGNFVAVVSDGSAVLGLGNIGGQASMPVMEGKAVLFKKFADVDAFPICLDTQDVDEIIETVVRIAPTFGGINLEDISAPRCFEIEQKLIEKIDIPVFHDDQHGTAIVTLAAMVNALKLLNKKINEITVVINGAGSAGIAITKLLLKSGLKKVIMCDSKGIIHKNREGLNQSKKEIAEITNINKIEGTLEDAIKNADVFIGVSAPGVLTKEMIGTMAKEPIIFAMANPVPEIMPDEAKEAGAAVIGTGRSDFANQINNVLAFPGIFRGALDVRARLINDEMKIAAAYAIASIISDSDLRADNIIPEAFNPEVAKKVAEAVIKAAKDTGVARI